jgi:hypothetical protein
MMRHLACLAFPLYTAGGPKFNPTRLTLSGHQNTFLGCQGKSPLPTGFSGGSKRGGVAQLGERLNGIQEVSGSIPLTSTTRE